MLFTEIFEKTKYAFEHDEVYELLMGRNDYVYQVERWYPVAIPTCIEFIFSDGIFPLYRQLAPDDQTVMLDKFISVLREMMRSVDEIDVWWATSLLYGQKMYEEEKISPFIIADNLLREIIPFLLINQEKLKQAKVYLGTRAKDGLWGDVLRYNLLLSRHYGVTLLDGVDIFDLKNGVLSAFGVQLSKNSVPEDLECLSNEIVNKSLSKNKNKYFRFLKPIQAAGVDMFLEVDFYADSKILQANLYPAISDSIKDNANGELAKYCVAASKRWLKHMIQEPVESESEDRIYYKFGEGYIYAATYKSRDYGLIGGEIQVRFEE